VAITSRVFELLEAAQPLFERHSVHPPEPELRFDLRGTAAGQARWSAGLRPVLRFNLTLAGASTSRFLEQTVAHEVAHLVTAACFGRTRPHGPEWRAIMEFFGLPNATRCHNYPVPPSTNRKQRRWSYACGCQTHQLSTTRHRRIENGRATYHCRRCGRQLRLLGRPG
jgi:SprT protein